MSSLFRNFALGFGQERTAIVMSAQLHEVKLNNAKSPRSKNVQTGTPEGRSGTSIYPTGIFRGRSGRILDERVVWRINGQRAASAACECEVWVRWRGSSRLQPEFYHGSSKVHRSTSRIDRPTSEVHPSTSRMNRCTLWCQSLDYRGTWIESNDSSNYTLESVTRLPKYIARLQEYIDVLRRYITRLQEYIDVLPKSLVDNFRPNYKNERGSVDNRKNVRSWNAGMNLRVWRHWRVT